MNHDARLDFAARLLAMGGIGIILNFLVNVFSAPTLPFGLDHSGYVWLPAAAVASVTAVWSGAAGGCLLLMRADRERRLIARSCLVFHAGMLALLVAGAVVSLVAAAEPRHVVSLKDAKLISDLALLIMCSTFGLALLAAYDATRVLYAIARQEIKAT